ncbi:MULTISPECIES: hypothetical protein [Microcystis]|nr:hypothetical protein [Microcystis aeruginosa]MCE2664755.1 hypothetical protein [Microcystis sp. 53602_E8]
MPKCFAPTGRGPMKTQKSCTCFARKATKPLPCLHFTFIQQTLFKLLILRLAESPPIPLLLPLASSQQAI